MRYFAALLLLAVLTSCVSDPEERDFFYSGWVNPNKPRVSAARNSGLPR